MVKKQVLTNSKKCFIEKLSNLLNLRKYLIKYNIMKKLKHFFLISLTNQNFSNYNSIEIGSNILNLRFNEIMVEEVSVIKEKTAHNLVTGIIGFGEVGQILALGLLENDQNVVVYDTRLANPEDSVGESIQKIGAQQVSSLRELAEKCDVVFSLVPSSVSNLVSNNFALNIREGTFFLDLTTSLPEVKKKSATRINSADGIYIDVSIMGTVATEKYQVPLLIAGEQAEEVKKIFNEFGLNSKVISRNIGAAASIKMLRSIFMKGIEALLFETMLTAEKYEVRKEVMDSISTTMRNNDFEKLADTLIITHIQHRERRHKEVQESISLVKEADIYPYVTEGVLSFFSNSVNKNKSNFFLHNNVEEILQYQLKQNE